MVIKKDRLLYFKIMYLQITFAILLFCFLMCLCVCNVSRTDGENILTKKSPSALAFIVGVLALVGTLCNLLIK